VVVPEPDVAAGATVVRAGALVVGPVDVAVVEQPERTAARSRAGNSFTALLRLSCFCASPGRKPTPRAYYGYAYGWTV
jgi:hypothetical protein